MIAESLGKTLAWTLWNSIFGFAPMFVIIFINFKSFLFPDTPTDSMLTWGGIGQKVMSDGLVMFFCCALMGEAGIDYVLSSKIKAHRYTSFIIAGSTLIFLVGVSILFGIFFNFPEINKNYTLLYKFQNVLIMITGIFCLFF